MELSQELLHDFFTEAEDHLAHIRDDLMQLEGSVGKAQADLATVQPLFREFHSLKGISAIVGLRAAENLAHRTEDYLRELSRGKVVLSRGGLELLMSAAQGLEQIIGNFRAKRPTVEDNALLNELQNIAQSTLESGNGVKLFKESYDEARARGLILWKCTFTPSQERDARGVNVNSIRARLCDAGEILNSVPHVLGEGRISFEFTVAMRETPSDIAAWEADGLVAELIDGSSPEKSSRSGAPVLNDAEHDPFIAQSHVVRVDLHRLDELMRIVGEMIIQRSRFEEELSRASSLKAPVRMAALDEVNTAMERQLRDLREAITRVRLVSVAEIFARMPFVVRDLSRDAQKKVRLRLEGQQTEIDKYLIEQLKDPLLHLVRNAFSHGIETVEERRAAGKADEATISLKAATAGDSVVIAISDDGRGVDREAVRLRAAQAGLALTKDADDAELLRILCAPGFSTRQEADRTSGRGVGMAVVQDTVRQLGGAITMETEERVGTTFIIRLPLTLTIAETIIVSAGEQTCAVPQSMVREVIQIADTDVRTVNGVEMIPYRAGVLPVSRLSSLFRLPRTPLTRPCVLVLASDRGSAGLMVDRVHGQKEVVVRAIRDPLIQVKGVSGATELGDGKAVLIIDGAAFTSGAVRPNTGDSAGVN